MITIPSTLNALIERVRFQLTGGAPSIDDPVQDTDAGLAICSAIGKVLKVDSLATHFSFDGGSIVDGALLATYTGIEVTRSAGNRCRALLPATPMILPLRQGVFSVYPSGFPDREFMPMPPGIYRSWIGVDLLNPIGDVIYVQESEWIEIYADVLGAGITHVDMKLAVVDYNRMNPNTLLPLTTDQEISVIDMVVAHFMAKGQATVNPTKKEA